MAARDNLRMSKAKDETKLTDESEWLPLGKAATLLGVHSMTLRRWSDSGRFPSYRTPGGHRRFAISDIQKYLLRQRGVEADEIGQDWADNALVATRQQVARELVGGPAWHEAEQGQPRPARGSSVAP